jgi:hypothetical protein
MESLQVKNLKSIADSGTIYIKPITVFVGRNSSGKSSLIRCFPLFKQSAESKTLGTVLWSGKYVDYGSFDESLNNVNRIDQKEISFRFTYALATANQRAFLPQGAKVDLTISVHGDEYSKSSYTNIEYVVFGSTISMRVNSDLKILSLYINGTEYTRPAAESYRAYKTYSIAPVLIATASRSLAGYDSNYSSLAKEIRQHVHHKTSDDRVRMIARSLKLSDDLGIIKTLSNKSLVGDFAAARIANWSIASPALKRIRDQIIFSNLDKIIDQITENFAAFFFASRYITPLRAAADRYYRIKNISIEELDPTGSNLAMFLHAKKESEIEEINNWLRAEMGFAIKIIGSHGHASIFIIDNITENMANIADTGFGISQVLPVLIQIWQLSKNPGRRLFSINAPTTIVIEQPELHLHPKMQSRVGDVFCKAVKLARMNSIDLRIVIETHSKDIIEAIGRCVENETIAKNDAAIYLVDKEHGVELSEFDEGGFLTQWPYGFFDGE